MITGWVRGAGSEQLANNANPAFNREMFEEGIDFIIKAWTTPGPFRYEGKHFHFRQSTRGSYHYKNHIRHFGFLV